MSTLTADQIADLRRRHADVPELDEDKGRHFIPVRHRQALLACTPVGADIREFRLMLQLTQEDFAAGLKISVSTLQNWEQDHRKPVGPALALLALVARHPRLLLSELIPIKGV